MLGEFIEPSGRLFPVLEAVRADPQLDLEIRDHYVNIYYRGTNLMEIRQPASGRESLTTSFDRRYLPTFGQDKSAWNPPPTRQDFEVEAWLLERKMLDRQPLRSAPEAQLDLLATANFQDWTALGTVTNTTGSNTFTMPATNPAAWFYRVMQH